MTKEDQKGFLRLIDIWELVQKNNRFQEWKLTIIGDGDKQEIEKKIKIKNLESSIILKPFTENIDKEYLKASIYVMTSCLGIKVLLKGQSLEPPPPQRRMFVIDNPIFRFIILV